MSPPKVISISGPDGAGKSTQAEKVLDALEDNGVDCEYRWFGAKHLFSLPLLVYARLMGLSEVEELDSGRRVGYHYFWRSQLVSTLYPILLLLDTCLYYFFRIYIPTAIHGKTIVCDRFVVDVIVRIMLSIGDEEFYRRTLGSLFLRLVPEDSLTVLLTTEPEILRERRDDVRADDTLDRMVEWYDTLAVARSIKTVDASEPPEEIHEEILALIE